MINYLKQYLAVVFLLVYVLLVFKPFIVDGKLPIPADTIVGLYHPWRDFFADRYPNGIPFKNSLITDAVRQQYPWRELAISQLKNGQWPLWNPYSFAGYPLMANLQSAPFYPLNFIYWLVSFSVGWSWQVVLQIFLGGVFMILFLRNLGLRPSAAALGTLAWTGSGFFISWLETNVVVQTAIWLPLILYSVDRLSFTRGGLAKLREIALWGAVFVGGLGASFLAGHLQIFFYVLLTAVIYALFRRLSLLLILVLLLVLLIMTSFWWVPAGQFILLSARNIDQVVWQKPDWFIPWQNAVQFIAPDFFGNPATLNYFGIWNYGEFVGYLGIIPLIFALFALTGDFSQKKFFVFLLAGTAFFAFPTLLAKLPFVLNLPFLSSAQPSRLIFLIDFSLAVLAAFGLDNYLKEKKMTTGMITIFVLLLSIMTFLWLTAFKLNLIVSLRNLVLPTGFLAGGITLIFLTGKISRFKTVFLGGVLLLTVLDSARFATKFLSFSSLEQLFPQTETTEFLRRRNEGYYRIAALDDRIMPANFSAAYSLPSIDGYDPLYLERYGELIAAAERNRPDISAPFGFNRIITPKNYQSPIFDLLGVKYFLSFSALSAPTYRKVFQEGKTLVYENSKVLPRAFFVKKVLTAVDKQQAINIMYLPDFNPTETAVVENYFGETNFTSGQATIMDYQPNKITVKVENSGPGFLVLTDAYYPLWKAEIDGQKTEIYLTDFAFRGVVVPKGTHLIRFYL